ncbi:MAG TPA: hypothetical protein VLB67_15585 [Acidimicrobiia bacterium]|nr:hypothetical protein [Acidimicrobiia bacterium]
MTDVRNIEIRGGVGPYEAAAIVAVIRENLLSEDRSRSRRPPDHRPPAWVRLGLGVPVGDFTPPVLPDPGRNWPVD